MMLADLFEQFIVLCRLEDGIYACHNDCFSTSDLAARERKITPRSPSIVSSTDLSPCVSILSLNSGDVQVYREEICKWIFEVVDHFDFNREIASVSLNYLDRYLSVRSVDMKTFQLAAMTSLFLAIKMYEHTRLKMSSYIKLSRGYFEAKDIIDMESSILWTLSWLVNPPTPLTFVRNFILLLEETNCIPTVALEVTEVARYLTELSVCDQYFSTHKPSLIGLGSVLAAFECFDETTLPMQVRSTFINLVRSMKVVNPSSKEVLNCKNRLYATLVQDTTAC